MKTNGKVYEFLKSHWRSLLFAFAIFAGVLCGFWTCSKHPTLSIDAHRNRIEVELVKPKLNR